MTVRRRFPTGDLSKLALFPLPNVVFFPNTVLPLHVFEPRYRRLVEDVLAGDRWLAVPRLKPGYEADYHGRPAVFEICGAGPILEHTTMPDGRHNILVAGLTRVRLIEELPSEPYRTARAEALKDSEPVSRAVEGAMRQRLLTLVHRLKPHLPGAGDGLERIVTDASTTAACADSLAAAICERLDDRQELLEELDPMLRLTRVVECLRALLPQSERGEADLS